MGSGFPRFVQTTPFVKSKAGGQPLVIPLDPAFTNNSQRGLYGSEVLLLCYFCWAWAAAFSFLKDAFFETTVAIFWPWSGALIYLIAEELWGSVESSRESFPTAILSQDFSLCWR